MRERSDGALAPRLVELQASHPSSACRLCSLRAMRKLPKLPEPEYFFDNHVRRDLLSLSCAVLIGTTARRMSSSGIEPRADEKRLPTSMCTEDGSDPHCRYSRSSRSEAARICYRVGTRDFPIERIYTRESWRSSSAKAVTLPFDYRDDPVWWDPEHPNCTSASEIAQSLARHPLSRGPSS